MICNGECPALLFKDIKTLSAVTLLVEMQVLSDWHFIKHEIAEAIFTRYFLQRVF
jgi:hypothetical protein